MEIFEIFQKVLIINIHFHYYDQKRQFYIDFDKFKKYDFGIIIYHVKNNFQNDIFFKIDIESIIFLFKFLNPAEFRYWFTKLEIAVLI